MQLLQKIQTFTDAPEGKTCIKSRGVKKHTAVDHSSNNTVLRIKGV